MTLLQRVLAAGRVLVGREQVQVSTVTTSAHVDVTVRPAPAAQRGGGHERASASDTMALQQAATRFVTMPQPRAMDLEDRMRLGEMQINQVLRDPRLPKLLELAQAQRQHASPPRRDYQPNVGIRLGGSMVVSDPKVYGGAPLILYAPVVTTNSIGRNVDAFGNRYRPDSGVGAGSVCLGYTDHFNGPAEFIQPIKRHHCADIDPARLAEELNKLIDAAVSKQGLPPQLIGYAYEL